MRYLCIILALLTLAGCAKPVLRAWEGEMFTLCCENCRTERFWTEAADNICPDGYELIGEHDQAMGGVIAPYTTVLVPSIEKCRKYVCKGIIHR